jgi:hypothetical protein
MLPSYIEFFEKRSQFKSHSGIRADEADHAAQGSLLTSILIGKGLRWQTKSVLRKRLKRIL